MPTATTTPQILINSIQATIDQQNAFEAIKEAKKGRIMNGYILNGHLVINYRTKTGYFVRAKYDQYGQQILKEYFHNWNETDETPFNPVFS